MELKVDKQSVETSIDDLERLSRDTNAAVHNAGFDVINGSYSSVSGLDQLGISHGHVLNGGAGSSHVVLDSYAEQIQWLKNALKASVDALNGQDELFARGMEIADTGGQVGEESVVFPPRPAPRFDSFSFPSPSVRAPSSIDELCSDFSGTNSGAVSAAQSSWTTMASTISEVSASLDRVAGELLASNSGEVFEQASARITEVAQAGSTFSQNAREMSRSVGTLNKIYLGHKMQVFLASMSISMIKDPVERAAAESSFLASFESSFQSDVTAGVPGIDNLMRMRNSDGSGGDVALGLSDIKGSGESFTTQGLAPQGFSGGGGGVAAAPTIGAGSFGTVANSLDGMKVNDLQTMVASVGAGSPGVSSPGLTGVAGGVGGAGSVAGGPAGGVPMMGSTARPGFAGGGPRFSNAGLHQLMGSRTQSASALGSMPPMVGAGGAGVGSGASGAGAAGINGARANSRQALASSGGNTQSAAGLTGGAGGVGAKASQSMPRPMMPMMPLGAAGGGNQKNAGKVKSVTSAVEEDANIAALLGDRGPVVPGVIGDWVRR